MAEWKFWSAPPTSGRQSILGNLLRALPAEGILRHHVLKQINIGGVLIFEYQNAGQALDGPIDKLMSGA
jgi:hypothetical protein